jgi:hypothetical protein
MTRPRATQAELGGPLPRSAQAAENLAPALTARHIDKRMPAPQRICTS